MKLLKILFLILICSSFAFSQKKVTTIQLGQDKEIIKIEKNDNSLNVIGKVKDKQDYFVKLYDNDGNEKFAKNFSRYVGDLKVLKNGKQAIIISPGMSESKKTEISDLIGIYDLNTGDKIWEANAIANTYELSKDQTKLLTNSPSHNERGGTLKIIKLFSSEIREIPLERISFNAKWLDNERIVILTSGNILNPEYVKFKNEREQIISDTTQLYKNEIDKITQLYKTGKMEEDKFKQKLHELLHHMTVYESKMKQERVKLKGKRIPVRVYPNKYIKAQTKIEIYNINTGIFENKVYPFNNIKNVYALMSYDFGPVFVIDEEIFVVGYEKDTEIKYFIKMDKDLNILETTKVEVYSGDIEEYEIDDIPLLVLNKYQDFEVLNSKTGKFEKNESLKSIIINQNKLFPHNFQIKTNTTFQKQQNKIIVNMGEK